jgi:hypothetical protein
MLLLSSFVFVPVFFWFDAPKAVEYLEKWKMFQVCADAAKYPRASLSLQVQTWLVNQPCTPLVRFTFSGFTEYLFFCPSM